MGIENKLNDCVTTNGQFSFSNEVINLYYFNE